MDNAIHEVATPHLPPFITAPGQTDILMVIMVLVLVGAILAGGVFFFWLHSLPERMVHHKVQFDLVAVLALLSLFTHIHAFWVAALLLAFIDIPDFTFPHFGKAFDSMAKSLAAMAPHPPEALSDIGSSNAVASQNVETLRADAATGTHRKKEG